MSTEPNTRVLFLGPSASPLLHWIRGKEATVFQTEDVISKQYIVSNAINFIVSYGYRHIIGADVLEAVQGNAINLHISYLPWNRGADPNLWSYIEGTPKGVTLHFIDEGIDTGDIIAQKYVHHHCSSETLASSYASLQNAIQALFKEHWKSIKGGTCSRTKQNLDEGSLHRAKDKKQYASLLTAGWDTPVSVLNDEDHNPS